MSVFNFMLYNTASGVTPVRGNLMLDSFSLEHIIRQRE